MPKKVAWSINAARSDADIASNVVRIGAAPTGAVTPDDGLLLESGKASESDRDVEVAAVPR